MARLLAVSALALTACNGSLTVDGGVDAAADLGATDARVDASHDAGVDAPSAPDLGSDLGPPPGDCTGRILCDDFESYAVGGAPGGPWEVSTNMASLVVDDASGVGGSRALHIQTVGGTGTYRRAFASVSGAPYFPLSGTAMWGRMRIYAVQLPGAGAAVHWTNVQAEGPIPSMSGVTALYRYGGMNSDRWIANYETSGASSDCWRNSVTPMQAGRWVCMEWHFEQTTNAMELYVDGTRIDDVAVTGTGDGCVSSSWTSPWLAGDWSVLRVGWEHYQQSIAHEVWVDDVAMDTARIGCP